jgi:methylase of polypeptide subunit release factors
MADAPSLTQADEALLALLRRLEACGYDFVTPTPLTHARVLARSEKRVAHDLRDVLGWSCPFAPEILDPAILDLLQRSEALTSQDGLWKSTIRVSRIHGLLFLHSAYPTEAEDAVFLGPDSYRFADFIARELGGRSWIGRTADVGGGAGVGALTAAVGRQAREVILTDVNRQALRLARLNAAQAGVRLTALEASGLAEVPDGCDLILANPPYIVDAKGRAYRDGGDLHGGRVSLDWAKAAIPKLAPGGRLLLYTGAAILAGGRNPLRTALGHLAEAAGVTLACRELDPDVFGEELESAPYCDVERIAVIGATFTRPRATAPQN